MFKNSADIELKYKRFLKEVIQNQEVYTLKNNHGYVSSSSHHFENENQEPLLLQLFWSNSKEASVCSRHVWKKEGFKLEYIALKDFIEFWCAGMYKNEVIVGINFDHQLFGYEEAPLELAKELLILAQSSNIKIKFENYRSIDEFLEIIESNL